MIPFNLHTVKPVSCLIIILSLYGYVHVDIDECSNGENTCSPNANCYNTDGGYICQCKVGYNGDGYYCGKLAKVWFVLR